MMPQRSRRPSQRRISANLPAEFFAASQLQRLGHIVTLTLGQTKEIDLFVETPGGKEVTVDVKGLKNKTNWPLRVRRERPNHYFILVAYSNKFDDLSASPETFVIPANRIRRYLGHWSGSV